MATMADKAQRLYQKAFALQQAGKFKDASEGYLKLLKIAPGNPVALTNLAICQGRLGRHRQALGNLREANRARPGDWRILGALGACFYQLGDAAEAVKALGASLRIEPRNPDAQFWAGLALEKLGDIDEAIKALTASAGPKRANAAALKELARIHGGRGDAGAEFDAALGAWRAAPERADYNVHARDAAARTCAWDQFEELDAAFEAQLKSAEIPDDAYVGEPFRTLARADDRHMQLRLSRGMTTKLLAEEAGARPYKTHPSFHGDRPLRVGYISANFHDSATMHLMAGVFREHDPSRVAFCCYSLGPDSDHAYREMLVERSEAFHTVRDLPTAEIAERIHKDEIDLLIDLKGHTVNARIAVGALRPAPVQALFLGFPSTSGAPFLDYVVIDEVVAPPSHADGYSEVLAYHPTCYLPFDNQQSAALETPSRAALGLPEDGVVFSSFNRPFKIDPIRFQSWLEILKRVEGSVLWLWRENDSASAILRSRAEAAGVAPERLIFGDHASKDAHLARLKQCDLGLDTRIYNGHTTTTDLLTAGSPVIATLGAQFASRVSGSVLAAIGMSDLVAADEADFVERSVALGRDREALADLKSRIATAKETSPFFDAAAYTRRLEDLYAAMVTRGPAPSDRAPLRLS